MIRTSYHRSGVSDRSPIRDLRLETAQYVYMCHHNNHHNVNHVHMTITIRIMQILSKKQPGGLNFEVRQAIRLHLHCMAHPPDALLAVLSVHAFGADQDHL